MEKKSQMATIIKSLRKNRGMTQQELAKAINQSPSSITMYETGRRTPDLEAMEALAKVFNVTIYDLIPTSGEEIEYKPFTGEPIVIESSSILGEMLRYMTREEYDFVIKAFNNARDRMREKGIDI